MTSHLIDLNAVATEGTDPNEVDLLCCDRTVRPGGSPRCSPPQRPTAIRNRAMAALGAHVCVAFLDGSACRGTRGCIREAARAGVRVRPWFVDDAARVRHVDLIEKYGAGVTA